MVTVNTIEINPPLLNSSCAWSSDLKQLSDLYDSPYTGAITTRTATSYGFKEDDNHNVAFALTSLSTINSYGYSPHPLSDYLSWTADILTSNPSSTKPIIISITASEPEDLRSMVQSIQTLRQSPKNRSRVAIELNTSCPNIPSSPPTGYSFDSLLPLLQVLADAYNGDATLTIGLKLPPYVYKDQFNGVITGLGSFVTIAGDLPGGCPFAFLTCTNTLGSTLLFTTEAQASGDSLSFAVPTGLGGLGGESLHPLALGNVYTFKRILQTEEAKKAGLGDVKIIGVGGVTSKEAAARMRAAGADAVACATLYGKEGVHAFEILSRQSI